MTSCTCLFLAVILASGAWAAEDTALRVGLRYGSSALFSANLENAEGCGWGYSFGRFLEDGSFLTLGYTGENTISMTAGGAFYVAGDGTYSASPTGGQAVGAFSLELARRFSSFGDATHAAAQFDGGFPAWVEGSYRVRIGNWSSRAEAEAKAALYAGTTWRDASNTVYDFAAGVVTASGTAVTVTVTRTARVLFQFDGGGEVHLGILPDAAGAPEAITWFKGYRYRGGFEYRRAGSALTVINVVGLEDYVKGVIPYEMSASWPLEALKAQAVCARTYAVRSTKHLSQGFDICTGTDCQVYYGVGSATERTDRAVEETAGLCVWYGGELAETVYCSSNGGASESAENVWGGSDAGYLAGKADPYEALTEIPDYRYTVTYTAAELTRILRDKGYDLGTVQNVYVSRYSPSGNAIQVTVEGTAGSRLFTGDTCRTIFNSSSLGKSVRSLRYTITGGSAGGYPVNQGSSLPSLSGAYLISGAGEITPYAGSSEEAWILTPEGLAPLGEAPEAESSSGVFTIQGTGFGHNVGMSQYGAKAMAEQGLLFSDILHFYYTDITLEKAG